MSGPRAGVALSIRQLWQQYPKELEVTPGTLTAHLWSSRGGREMDLRTETLLKEWPREWLNEEYHGHGSYGPAFGNLLQNRSSAFGMAKTHELLL